MTQSPGKYDQKSILKSCLNETPLICPFTSEIPLQLFRSAILTKLLFIKIRSQRKEQRNSSVGIFFHDLHTRTRYALFGFIIQHENAQCFWLPAQSIDINSYVEYSFYTHTGTYNAEKSPSNSAQIRISIRVELSSLHRIQTHMLCGKLGMNRAQSDTFLTFSDINCPSWLTQSTMLILIFLSSFCMSRRDQISVTEQDQSIIVGYCFFYIISHLF
jgi:hypothetical protein